MLEIPVNPTQVNPSADLSLYLMDVIQSIWAQHWVTQVGDESEWMRGKKKSSSEYFIYNIFILELYSYKYSLTIY